MPGLNKNITVRLMADASSFNAGIKAAGTNAEKLAEGMEQSGRKTSLITTGLAAAGVAATAIGAAAVKMSADFDASMSGVQSATMASAADMDLLRQAAIQAGADTIYGASDAAGAIEELGKAGISTADILSGGLSGALDLAASDGMEVADAAGYMSTALTQFNLKGSDATHVADVLAAGAGKALGSVHDMGEALNNAGTTASTFNMSLEDTVGVLAAFASAGIIGAEGGTQLRSLLLSLTNQTTKQKEVMEEYGLTLYDQQGKFVGLANLAGQLQDKLGGLSQEQRNNALSTLFGSYAIQGANILYKEGAEGIEEWTKAVDDSGYASEMAAARTDNLQGDLEQLSGSVETLMINLGSSAQGPLRSLVQTLNTLVDGFSSLPEPVQQFVVVAVAAVGGATALHKALEPLNNSSSGAARGFALMLDPAQRLMQAIPQLNGGLSQLAQAMVGTDTGVGLMNNGLTRGQTAMNGFRSVADGLVTLMGGPWGIAFGIAGAALMSWSKNAQEAKQQADSIKSAMQTTGDATQALVDIIQDMDLGKGNGLPEWMDSLTLHAENVPDLLDQVGLSISDVALAAQGNADALDRYNEVMKSIEGAGTAGAARAAELQNILDQATSAYNDGTEAAQQNADAVDEVSEANGAAAESTGALGDAMSESADDAQELNDQIDDLLDAMFQLEGINVSAYEAQTALQESIQSLSDSLAENGNTLDINTESGRANRDALASLASQAQDTAQAILEEGVANNDLAGATDTARASLEQARQAFINAARAAGMTQEDAAALADQFGLTGSKADALAQSINAIPDSKNVTVTANTSQAESSIMRLVNGNWSTTIRVRASDDGASLTIGRLKASAMADGGLVGYADGGLMADRPLMGLASGDGYTGLINGWGGKKADVVPIMASRGEFMQQASAVDYYGVANMRALNERRIPREWLAGPQAVNTGVNDNRSYNITLQVTGTPDPEVTARETFEIFRREMRRLG